MFTLREYISGGYNRQRQQLEDTVRRMRPGSVLAQAQHI